MTGAAGGVQEHRFTDPGVTLRQLADEVLVRCPECGGRALVLARPGGECEHRWIGGREHTRRLLSCGCGRVVDGFLVGRRFAPGCDPYFGLPLWLDAECRGRRLWAYNLAHLDVLEGYVGAGLRERGTVPGPMSLVERLPAWVKSARHRDAVLRTIRKLRATVPPPPPS
ncbi:hypothetical protein [Kitasatospora brasiliensis]|uniref:hypothetical protein n=1 Tax=Kitasatospora brasiliensis TaxID=3058040 RepID=UPI00292D1FC1|nr:hypothetical protein [Kitasatospora sp. K002]